MPCPACGFADGAAECKDLFTEVTLRVRALAWTGSLRTWRLMHDVYSVQHEEDYCGRYRGLIMHLGGLCWALEHSGQEGGYRALQQYVELDLFASEPYPPPPGIPAPAARGSITVAVLRELNEPERLAAGVDRWARAAWLAYAPLQPIAREWIRDALARRKKSG
jgi:hypothetical protein